MIKIGKDISRWGSYSYQPKTKEELKKIINDRIAKEGYECDLNDIDVSLITDMSGLFDCSFFNGDISNWDVSNVNYMNGMFAYSKFNGDISEWNTSKVTRMGWMFENSHFNGDISNWDVSKVKDISYMFAYSEFNQDISKWRINNKCFTIAIFNNCPIKEEYKPKSLQS